jgi:endonuclease V-like protein UPF0215 family
LVLRGIRVIKPEIRVIGIDDGIFVPRSKKQAPIIGVVFRGGWWLEGVISTHVTVDGLDATANIAHMIKGSSHYGQLRVILLNGITFAGFNVVDIEKLRNETMLPVIAVTNKKPNLNKIHIALRNLPQNEKRWSAVLTAGKIIPISTRSEKEKIFVEFTGITEDNVTKILRLTATKSKIPEVLRVAHLVASGISNVRQ